MPNILKSVTQAVVNAFSAPFTLEALENFPVDSWNVQSDNYRVLNEWYGGTILQEYITDKKTNTSVEKYPIKLNPIRNTCEKHAATLVGVTLDSIQQGAMPIKFLVDPTKAPADQVKRIEEALKNVFEESAGGATFAQDAIHSQYLGGCVWVASWLPESDKLLVWSPLPSEFIGIPEGPDYFTLREAWIVKELTEDEVKAYAAYKISGNEKKFWYIEHWTRTEHNVWINEQSLIDNQSNPFGVVPVVYIPHIRVNKFLGQSIITEMVKGLVRELNLREADMGDAVSEDSHSYIWVRNVRGTLHTIQLGDGRPIVQLGATSGLTANENNPDMQAVQNKSASEPMLNFNKSLYDYYRIEVNHPAVADGVDQGSQRSSVTLNARMWPLIAHVEMERIFWSIGMNAFAKILLKMMQVKDKYDITTADLNPQLVIQWNTMLPKDREAMVQEVAIRAKNKVGSRKHLMSLLGDTPDLDAELAQIKAELPLDNVQKGFGAPGGGGGSTP